MDLGTVLSVAQTLFAALQCSELREVCSILGYERELENLERTVNIVKAVLEEAESKQMQAELPPQAQLYVDQLKDAVYDADDLLDEFVTLAQRKKLIKGGQISEKVRLLFSSFNPLTAAHRMSRGVKEIRKKLDDIANDHAKFGFKLESKPILRRREETCSYVYAPDIIGREDDVEKIMHKLLDPDVKQDVSCLAIVGIGGLGKTALAQLLYNHPRIKENFPLRPWTCVADQDVKDLDVDATLRKILHSATSKNHEHLSMDHVQRQLQEQLAGKKYFLVLDDIWNEDRNQWLKLMGFLRGGVKGSWVIVTTRSRITATSVGGEIYDLKGLSNEDSWLLFEKTAFGEDHEETTRLELDQIGREIVEQCANVPLAIRVVGSALYGQEKKKWLSFQEVGLGRIKEAAKSIQPLLKFSYLHLEPQLKICFSYCAIFPKDFVIEKEMLINLWIAQGYVVRSEFDKGRSIEDIGEEYFLILLRRCFFQDVRNVHKNIYDGIITFKMHDLMHDMAQEVAGKEIPEANSIPSNSDANKIRHLTHCHRSSGTESLFTGSKIRTFLRVGYNSSESLTFGTLPANWISLRALDLSYSKMTYLPSTLGKLLHLRYLNLSENDELEVLPNSITKLYNLQILLLLGCSKLKELPKSLGKLANLRVLDTRGCLSLTHMPRGVGKLSCLWKLPFFVVGERTSRKEGGELAEQLQEIKALKNLKGKLTIEIKFPQNAKYVTGNRRKGGYLSQHLTEIIIRFPRYSDKLGRTRADDIDEALLEDLQPHPNSNLKELWLVGYRGERMPNWAREENLTMFLPNLVFIELSCCDKLQYLSGLGKLPELKSLVLKCLDDLEYIENTAMSRNGSGEGALESQESFFPSLENLTLQELPKLKGWWRSDDSNTNGQHAQLLPSFPRLYHLQIWECPNLACMPLCPSVEHLEIMDCNVNLRIMESIESGNSKLRRVETDNIGHLKVALPMEAFQCLTRMIIYSDSTVQNLSEVEEVFLNCSSSLRQLGITGCPKLKSVSGGLKHLTALESLRLDWLPCLSLSKAGEGEGEEEDGMPWRCLHHSLRSLLLSDLPKMVKLPNGMRHLTALQFLEIQHCEALETVPEWMPELTSLKTLYMFKCSDGLKERCHKPTGEDWPHIQHIPDVRFW